MKFYLPKIQMMKLCCKARQGKARQGKARQGKARVLIVYDEPEVHAVTVLALKDFVFQEKHLEFINTFI